MPARSCNYLQACLLLLLAERCDHGYELTERLAQFGLDHTDAAGVYRALRTLEGDGSVLSTWVPSRGGPARRVYQLTDRGRQVLAEHGDELRREKKQLDQYLARLDATIAAAATQTGATIGAGRIAHVAATADGRHLTRNTQTHRVTFS
jgi:poly-beta-hydroxybutyrate-responsive repressor